MTIIKGEKFILVSGTETSSAEMARQLFSKNEYTVKTFESEEEQKGFLDESSSDVHAIVLNCKASDEEGIAWIKRIKNMDHCKNIPIIIESEEGDDEHIAEGISAGAQYFLKKPYHQKIFTSVLEKALKDYTRFRFFQSSIKKFDVSKLVSKGEFRFRTLKEGHQVADWLTTLFPESREVIVVGFIELLVNAVEHGNLGIGYAEKTRLLAKHTYMQELIRRLEHPDFVDKFVQVSFERKGDDLEVWIEDEGKGFDSSQYLKISPERMLHSHGRGIAMAKALYFKEVEYIEPGNKVRILADLKTEGIQ